MSQTVEEVAPPSKPSGFRNRFSAACAKAVDGVGSVVPPRMIAVSLPDSGSSAWAAGLLRTLAMPTNKPTAATFLYPFTATPFVLSPPRPHWDLRSSHLLS